MTKAMALLVTGSACLMLLAGCVNPNYTPLSKGSFTKGASAVDTSKLTLITPEMVAKNRAASALPGSTAQTLTPFVSAQPQTLDFQPVPQPAPMVDPSTVPGMISAPMQMPPMQMPPMQMPPMQTPMSGGYSMGPVGMAPMGAPYGMQPMGPQMGQQIGMPPMGAPFGMQAMGPQMAPQFGMPPMAGQMGLNPMGSQMGPNPMSPMGYGGQPMVPDFGPATYGLSSYSNFARPRVYSGVQITDISHEADLVSPDSMLSAPLTRTDLDPQAITADSPAYQFTTKVPRRAESTASSSSRSTGLRHSSGTDMARSTTNVFMRSGPGKEHKTLDVLKQGSSAPVEYCDAGWCKVTYKGKDGFVSAKYLRFFTN